MPFVGRKAQRDESVRPVWTPTVIEGIVDRFGISNPEDGIGFLTFQNDPKIYEFQCRQGRPSISNDLKWKNLGAEMALTRTGDRVRLTQFHPTSLTSCVLENLTVQEMRQDVVNPILEPSTV
jgi:hypothetical protein